MRERLGGGKARYAKLGSAGSSHFPLAIGREWSVTVSGGEGDGGVPHVGGTARRAARDLAAKEEKAMPSQITLKDAGPQYFEALTAAAKNPRTVDT